MSSAGGRGGPRRLAAALAVAALVGPALAQPAPAASSTPGLSGVWYEIFVRSFQDSNGDGIGDLRGVTQRLPYLASLGVTGVWLMPIHPSPSYHGYDVTDYRAVNPDYGTLDDLRALLDEAHRLGLRVALDLVPNHTSDRHPWFLAAAAGDPAYRDRYVWSDTRLDWRGTRGGSAWHALPGAGGQGPYYLGLFSAAMPDLNYRDPATVRAMQDVVRYWLDVGVDGFRVDAIQHIVEGDDGTIANTDGTFAWVREMEAYVHSVRPDAFLVGETWTDMPAIRRYLVDGELDAAFDYPRWKTLLSAVQTRSAADLATLLDQEDRLLPGGGRLATFLANHDQIRPATTLSFVQRDVPRLKLAASLLMLLPGTPFVYYGEEIGMPNGPGSDDVEKRTPMRWDGGPGAGFTDGQPWTAFSTTDEGIDVAFQEADPTSLWWTYRRLIALRRLHPALDHGTTEVVEGGPRALLALSRRADGERVVVLANLGTRAVSVPAASLGLGRARDLLDGSTVDAAAAADVQVPGLGVRALLVEGP